MSGPEPVAVAAAVGVRTGAVGEVTGPAEVGLGFGSEERTSDWRCVNVLICGTVTAVGGAESFNSLLLF